MKRRIYHVVQIDMFDIIPKHVKTFRVSTPTLAKSARGDGAGEDPVLKKSVFHSKSKNNEGS